MKDNAMQIWLNSSYLTSTNQSYIEELYKKFLNNPDTVDINWNVIFNNLSKSEIRNTVLPKQEKKNLNYSNSSESTIKLHSPQEKIYRLIEAFRTHGYRYTQLDPLEIWQPNFIECLNLNSYNFTERDFQDEFHVDCFAFPNKVVKLIDLYNTLKKIYCNSIGIEYMHIHDTEQILWIQKNIETSYDMNFSAMEQKQLLNEIIQSENIERYLHIAFPGTKRFSLEGGDVLIPMLKEIIRYAVHYKMKKIILGMAHRGRLNVLINILNKPPRDLFTEFSDKNKDRNYIYSGDVKYHQGRSSIINVKGRSVDISLLPNPSHLEIISPVVMGFTRAYIDSLDDTINQTATVLPITIHGDAAISGQGIVQETLNMSEVPAYNVGGTIRIVINNQIGFTTSHPNSLRSSQYCTDIGKTFQIPIFHVNADNPEKVIFITRTALNFRNTFKRDVLLDLVCYRRHGHNEADDPSVTQPLMYKKIQQQPTLYKIYSKYLKDKKIITDTEISNMVDTFQNFLNKEKSKSENNFSPITENKTVSSQKYTIQNKKQCVYMEYDYLKKLACSISSLPKSFKVHPRVDKIYQARMGMAKENRPFDWGGAEILAYATLLDHGFSVRLSGEDTVRGTFFHRHVTVYNQNNGNCYTPLANISKNQGNFSIWNSVLSEESALAFEYGYSIYPSLKKTLVVWEAQFGDFANGAQVVIDQFLSSGEQKWRQVSNLVMLLPHGYEGQGPEHSSARLERYLQLCAENNMIVCIPSTPSQIYHLLRYHALSNIRKPLIIMTPKSLLRHPMVHASFNELISGSFHQVINEKDDNINPKNVTRVLLCSGKIYYDLIETRQKNKKYNTAIIRIEQLYPFPIQAIRKIFDMYTNVKYVIWCQEEPKNQGAWNYNKNYFYKIIPNHILLNYVGRPDSSAPATGYFSLHQKQHTALLHNALDIN